MKRFLVLFLVALASPNLGRANISAMGTGNSSTGTLTLADGKLHPLENHPTASIAREDLHIQLHDKFATVDLTYTLKNAGKATKVQAGFPSIAASFDIEESEEGPQPRAATTTPRDLLDYKIEFDGKTLAWKLRDRGKIEPKKRAEQDITRSAMTRYKQWLVSELPLAANGSHQLHITYRCPYEVFEYYVSDDGNISDAIFAYLLSTGSNWHGPIGSGKVEIECAGVDADHIKITPEKRFKRSGKSFTWEFTDLEPTTADDLRVIVDPAHEERRGYILYPDRWYYRGKPDEIAASSELKEKDKVFSVNNLVEYEESCWAEGAEGDGIGETITMTLKEPGKLDGLFIRNGFYAALEEEPLKRLYKANNRVAQFQVQVDDHPPFKVDVTDTPEESFVRFPSGALQGSKVKLTISAVHKGAKYSDTCIAALGLRRVLTKKPEPGHAR